ncbi:hypothetical protein DMN91_009760 [Ooceraea biroi]|uniref:THAP-type domain-containing protein n=1 Tax=Ooceraea biroi TaxID=2015173 RepID=A0A3L8DAJ4_OOCBI|nr:hypothetical protein DMN91_009760 [Ooceraea biroi]
MVRVCVASGCSTKENEGKLLLRFPKNPERRCQWIELVQKTKPGWRIKTNSCLCELHFDTSSWEEIRVDGTRKLKESALPNVFQRSSPCMNVETDHTYVQTTKQQYLLSEVHFDDGQYEQARQDERKLLRSCVISTLLQKRKIKKEKEEKAKKAKYSNDVEDLESRNYTEITNSEVIHTGPTNSVTYTETSNTRTTNEDISRDTTNTMSEKEQIKHLQITLRKTLRQCSELKRKLQQRNVILEKIFADDQINLILNNTQRGASWSTETLDKALKLYVACGSKGYEEICQQNLPYPSIRTIQHHIRGFKSKPGILKDFLQVLTL